MDDASQISKRDMKLMDLAYREACKGIGTQQLGAVVIKGGKVLSKGFNCYENCRHAEVAALARIWRSEREGAILFVARKRKDRKYGLAHPCPDCQDFIKLSGIKKVYYTTNDVNNPIVCERF